MATATKSNKQAQPANKPLKELRSGNIRAVVWANESENGKWYSITISRSYKTSGGEWKETNQFNRDDLLVVSKLAEFAYQFISSQS